MFEGFERTEIRTSGARIHLRHGGEGPPLLLLHGNPLTHVSWHKIANRLATDFRVVAADLRGYGDSVGPEDGGENHINLPSYYIWTHASKDWAMKSWHWLFMAQPYDLPERMMAAVPAQWYLEKKLSKPGIGLACFAPDAFAEYVRCFTWKTIRGSCEDYRACATCDLEMDTADKDRKVRCPLLVIWGARSHTGTVYGDVLQIWRGFGEDVVGGPIDCGHYVPEEAPEETYRRFVGFFGGRSA